MRTTTDIQATRRARRRTTAFTLVELLVAVSVVAVLTLGIGQIFGSISRLVGTGAAVAEVDQMARTIEARMRRDFEALSRLDAEEAFLAIRQTRVGDFDRDGTFEAGVGEVDLYLTPEDEQYDLRQNLDPYQRSSSTGRPLSRAITVRLDEIMFVGFDGLGYTSFQGGDAQKAVAQHAIITYGHGLRPPLDESDPPRRLNFADGHFGQTVGDTNRFAPSSESVTGRNRFAGDFVLTRQAMLLLGPEAMGYEQPDLRSILGPDAEIALTPRDMESEWLFFGAPGVADDAGGTFPLGGPAIDAALPSPGRAWWAWSKPRLIRHGRVDICAMSFDRLRPWLQGETTAYEGALPALLSPTPNMVWERLLEPPAGPAYLKYTRNVRRYQSAIAGMFTRRLVETEPANFRFDPSEYSDPKPDPSDRRMDIHAIIADHCSSFEVAWSDGSRWDGGSTGAEFFIADVDGDGTNEREISPGSLIWFDMDFTFSDLWTTLENDYGVPLSALETRYPRPNPDPEIGLGAGRTFDTMPEPHGAQAANRRRVNNGGLVVGNAPDPTFSMPYSPIYNQGAERDDHEYLAVWGFQEPNGTRGFLSSGAGLPNGAIIGNYSGPWIKPKLIRVRLTLHDSQKRLDGGKTFEFIFRVDLK